MSELADLFAYMYEADLPTLRHVVQEAIRILRERENATRTVVPVSHTGCEEL